jgi:hypothetical protein
VFLHRLWGRESPIYRSWAVEPSLDPLALEAWRSLGVDVFEVELEDYAAELQRRIAAEVPA